MTDPGFDPADIQPFKFGYGTGHYTQEFNRMMLRIMVMVLMIMMMVVMLVMIINIRLFGRKPLK